MELKDMIKADFQERIRLVPIPEELRAALGNHERQPKFLRNLLIELKKCEEQKLFLDRKAIKEMVYNLTDVFISCVKEQVEAAYASQLKRSAEQAKEAELAKFDKDGNADFRDEYGILIGDGDGNETKTGG